MEFFRKENEEPAPKFVRRKDDITGDEEELMRVEMSCGHAADPGSLTGWCRSLLDQGHLKFHCPADVNGEKCGKEWSYPEVRRNASITEAEQRNFEEKLAKFAAKYYHDYKECPNCHSYVERQDLKNLRVVCILCHSLKGQGFEFCWQCLKPWKGGGAPSERCENVGCKNQSLEVLANCKLKDLPGSEIKNCPSIRACPTCGRLIEHMEKCKYIVCPQCHVEFCFACLEIARNCQASKRGAYFQYCAKPLAPKQTQIPVWAQK
ncbi:E3 ubiquitin-protein ligase DDB_G0292642-like [Emys orbicularis]|uniref:E3 ubiquitin-protein ligase DDB_G0292642-like n=1 Tax=Emys orbicularis TaxID=82168 RepID=UPI0031FDBF55